MVLPVYRSGMKFSQNSKSNTAGCDKPVAAKTLSLEFPFHFRAESSILTDSLKPSLISEVHIELGESITMRFILVGF